MVASGHDLVGECVSIVALLVGKHGEEDDVTVSHMVEQSQGGADADAAGGGGGDSGDFVLEYSSYQHLEDLAHDKKVFNCRHH